MNTTLSDAEGKPMTDQQAFADRFEIEALRGEFADAAMTRDFDRLAALFTPDAAWRIPAAGIEFTGRETIRDGIEGLQTHWEFLIQTVHPGTVQLDGDTASGRSYIAELGRFRDGTSHRNHGVYHDRYRHTPDGWRFTERVYEIQYHDATPLTGSAAHPAEAR
jgi:ketosteroid isomerase-like protein